MPIILTQSNDKQNIKDNFDCNNIILSIACNDSLGYDSCVFCLRGDGLIGEREDLVFYNSDKRWKALDYQQVLEGNEDTFDSNKYRHKKQWYDCTIPVSTDCAVIGPVDEYMQIPNVTVHTESFCLLLDKIDKDVKELVFCLFLYDADKFKRLLNVDNIRVYIYDYPCYFLTSVDVSKSIKGVPAMEICRLKRNTDDVWLLETLGAPVDGGIQELVDKYA